MNPTTVEYISECFVKPAYMPEEANDPFYLTLWDLAMLSVHYIQKGLLFPKPSATESQPDFKIANFLDSLKHALALTLVHFYPLAGRLSTTKSDDPPSYVVSVDCSNSPGARFVHAVVDLTVSDVLSPTYVPLVVQSFFDHDRALNHDGHFSSLLTIQVTELVDGIFIGCSMNHAIGDGSSYWHFLNSFSEIFEAGGDETKISCPPIIQRWFPDGVGPVINLPFTHHDQFLAPFEAPPLKERIFHFSSDTIAELKAKANKENNTSKISSYQSLSAFTWRCITRARNLPHDEITSCRVACNNRSRLNPALPTNYFGNCIQTLRAFTTAGELLEQSHGWAAYKIHQAVVNHNGEIIRKNLESWMESPTIYNIARLFDPNNSVMMGSSPKFNKYGSEFGLGKALALRSGYAHKFSGKVTAYPGREGGGSIDLELCLPPHMMDALESDKEFMNAVSLCSP